MVSVKAIVGGVVTVGVDVAVEVVISIDVVVAVIVKECEGVLIGVTVPDGVDVNMGV
jgi:hypothetical protein